MEILNSTTLSQLLHQLDSAINVSEDSFNRFILNPTLIERYKKNHSNAIKELRTLRKLLSETINGNQTINPSKEAP